MTQRIAITGASGFIGSALAQRFMKLGAHVVGLARRAAEQTSPNMTWRSFDLGVPDVSPDVLAGVDILIHAAMQAPSAENDAIETNIEGTRRLLAVAHACGVRRRILLSSFSAHDDARSAYGKQKCAVERLFSESSDTVIRPGLVIGNGGLFRRLADDLRTRRIVPLIDGGTQPLQTIHLDDLCDALERIVNQEIGGTFNLAEPTPIPFKLFYAELCSRLGVTPLFLPIPFAFAHLALAIASALHLPMPISSDTLLGLKAMRSRETNRDIRRLGIHVRDTRASLDTSFLLSSTTAAPI